MKNRKPFIYNPAQKGKEALAAEFVLRKNLYEKLLHDVKNASRDTPPQHYLVSGQRGMGKTTLLLRLKYAIENDEQINSYLLPVRFSEEQYNITRLERVWEETAELLATKYPEFEGLSDEMLEHENALDFEGACFALLEKRLKETNHRVLLLIDNIGDLFDKFPHLQHNRLREILMSSPFIQLVGCSSKVLEHTFQYDKPFFEFFEQFKLEPLDKQAAFDLLLALGREFNQEEVIQKIITTNPARIEVLRRLTGGVPRTMVLLFDIFVDSNDGSAFEDLQHLLDEVNSLYKHRMDELKPQQQQILDALARAWEPITAKEVLKRSRLDREDIKSNQISSQLKQLADNQIVEVLDGPKRRQLYRIRERFFNIWYLMRHGRKQNREEVLWLIKFLESWCSNQELRTLAVKQINKLKSGDYSEEGAYMKAMALQEIESMDFVVRDELMDTTYTFLKNKGKIEMAEAISKRSGLQENSILIKLIKSKVDLDSNAYIGFLKNKGNENLKEHELGLVYYFLGLEYRDSLNSSALAIHYFKLASQNKNVYGILELGMHHWKNSEIDLAIQYFSHAADFGVIRAYEVVIDLLVQKNDYLLAEEYAKRAIELDKDSITAQWLILHFELAKGMLSDAIARCEFLFGLPKLFDTKKLKYLHFIILTMISYDQNHFLHRHFKKENSPLMKHALPFYYVLAYFMKDELPGVYENTGSELKETVDEIIQNVLVAKENIRNQGLAKAE